jgi:hypothetical protein
LEGDIMAIVGFEFNKITAERSEGVAGKINIKNNVSIKSVQKLDLPVGKTKQSAARFGFEYDTFYEPKAGKISLTGSVTYLDETTKIDSAIKDWEKNKKVDKQILTVIINRILTKANIQTLILSDTINLPPQIPMPKVKTDVKAPEKK